MPVYDYRCKACGNRFALFYKTYADYDKAAPTCAECGGAALDRLITGVALPKPARDFTKMSSGEMLSVFESGDSRQVGEMFEQVGGADPHLGKEYHDATQKLLKGESMDKVERDLRNSLPAANDGAGSGAGDSGKSGTGSGGLSDI